MGGFEVGRQPWIVYNLMRTSDGLPLPAPRLWYHFTAFILVYGLAGAVGFYLMTKSVKEGPEAATA